MTPARGPVTITREELGAALEDQTDRLRVQTLDFYNVPSDEEGTTGTPPASRSR